MVIVSSFALVWGKYYPREIFPTLLVVIGGGYLTFGLWELMKKKKWLLYGMIFFVLQGYIYHVYKPISELLTPVYFIHSLVIILTILLIVAGFCIIKNPSDFCVQKRLSWFWYGFLALLISIYSLSGIVFYLRALDIFQIPELVIALYVVFGSFLLFLSKRNALFRRIFIAAILIFFTLIHYNYVRTIHPTNGKSWIPMMANQPYITLENGRIHVHNIRNFRYKTAYDFIPQWKDAVYDVNSITDVDYMVNPFTFWWNLAHVFLSFWFADGRHLTVSIEWRRTVYEYSDWDVFRWNLKQFEKVFIVADERDILPLRAVMWEGSLYYYPLKISPPDAKVLFLSLMEEETRMKDHPEFIEGPHNCSHNLWLHLEEIYPIPKYSPASFFWWNTDRFAYDHAMIDTHLDFETTKNNHFLDDLVAKYLFDENFSKKIRGK